MNLSQSQNSFWKELLSLAIPIGLQNLLLSLIGASDKLVKLPWLYQRYKKYLWLNNLTRETSP